ncbi:hypothetical protein NQ288_26900, partial [Escherichia coli]|nr:hypothetical protein [Escherichia coli]
MDENALGFTSYWRNSLADAESGKGSFERKDAKNFTHWHGIAAGRLDEAIVSKFFKGEKDDVETVDVILGNDSNLLIVFYVQIMPDDFVMQLHR